MLPFDPSDLDLLRAGLLYLHSMADRLSSFRIPSSGRPTPINLPAHLRPPIHNPYDKFPREEFDAWIGDLTSRIRRVLSHDEPFVKPAASPGHGDNDTAYDDEDIVEDSFADMKARRSAKGKERATESDTDDSEEELFVESIIIPADDEEEDEKDEEYDDDGEEQYDDEAYSDEEIIEVHHEPETIEISSDEDEPVARSHAAEVDEEQSEGVAYDDEGDESLEVAFNDEEPDTGGLSEG